MKGWTLAAVKRLAKEMGAAQQWDRPVRVNPRGAPRPKKRVKTEAEKQIEAEKRLKLHRQFETAWQQMGGPPLSAEVFTVQGRQYRSDYASTKARVTIELNGGTWSKKKMAHNSGAGLERDATKQNLVVINGWVPFVLTSTMLSKRNIARNLTPIIEFIKKRGG